MGKEDIWRKNVLHPPTVTGTRILDLPQERTTAATKERKTKGPKAGEGWWQLPGSPLRGLGLPPGRPSLGRVSHSHRERGRGTGARVGGPLRWQLLGNRLFSGGDSAFSSRSRPLLASLRRRRARPGSPECTARRERLLRSGRRGKCRKRGARTENERACVRARGGEAGRRLVTQQNARALPPRVRTLCFRAPARFSRDIYGKGGASQLLRDPSRRWPRPASAPSGPTRSRLSSRAPPLALESRWPRNRPATRVGRSPGETAVLTAGGRLRRRDAESGGLKSETAWLLLRE